MKIGKSKLILSTIEIVYIISFVFFYMAEKEKGIMLSRYYDIIFPWVIGLILVNIVIFSFMKYSIYDFGMWFIIMSFIFMFGTVFTQKYNFSSTLLWNPVGYYTYRQLFDSLSFAILCIATFSLGYMLAYENELRKLKSTSKETTINYNMFYIGGVLFVIGLVCRLYTDLNIIKNTVGFNSYSAYDLASSTGLFDDFVVFFIPGIAFLVFSNVLSKSKDNILIFFGLFYFFITMSLTGSRKTQIFSVLTLLLIYLANQKGKIKKTKIIISVFIAILLLNLMVTIRDNRFNIASILPIYFENIMSGKLLSTLAGEILTETGITLYSITNIISCVPTVFPFQYGMTFIKTIPSALPIGWLLPDFFDSVSSTNVINKYKQLPVGSSLFGDFYWNFGFCGGILFSFMFGILICFLMKKIGMVTQKEKAVYFSIFGYLILLVRSEPFDIYRSIVYVLVLIIIINAIVNRLRAK